MLKWLRKGRIVKRGIIDLNPVELSNVKVHEDGGVSFTVIRGSTIETIRMYSGDIFQLHREISVDLVEKQ